MQDKRRDVLANLTKRVTDLLGGCLGAMPYSIKSKTRAAGSWSVGFLIGLIYATLFCALPWLFFELFGSFGRPEEHLFWLSVYGSLYITWATITARSTSAGILEIITTGVLPALSEETAIRIDDELAKRFREQRLSRVSWTVACLGVVTVVYAITRDIHNVPFIQVAWWAAGWLFLFVTAAKSTNVARFYYVFAKHLEEEKQLYVFDPARSALIRDVSAVGQRILLFWVGIAISIALLIPFSGIVSYHIFDIYWRSVFSRHTTFELIVVPITSAFSIPFGTYVFLRSQSAIQKAVDKAVGKMLRSAESEIALLFAQRSTLTESQWKEVDELESLHARLTTAGSYRTILLSGLSLLVPLIGPAAELLKQFH